MGGIIGLIVITAVFFIAIHLDKKEERKWSRWQS
jgi:hypothetical protein